MQKITLPSHAKINLTLDVLGRKGHYHLIQTVYQQIDLHDTVTVELNNSEKIICKEKLAKKAAELFFQKTTLKKIRQFTGAMIKIKKQIPYYSGLGGCSSTAAAVLRGLNKLYEYPLSQKDLMKIGVDLGMDVPFFVSDCKTAIGTHYGEKIEPLPSCPKFSYKLYFSKNKKTSTADMYKKLNLSHCGKNRNKTQKLIQGIKKGDSKIILENLHNDFEQLWDLPGQHDLPGQQPMVNSQWSTANGQHFLLAGSGPTWIIVRA